MSTKKILIADDNLDSRDLLSEMLQGNNYELFTAKDGVETIRKIEDHLPDLILIDIIMPGKSGYEVCDWVRENARTRHILIIIISASSERTHREEGLRRGESDYIAKPIDAADLLRRVQKLLRPSLPSGRRSIAP